MKKIYKENIQSQHTACDFVEYFRYIFANNFYTDGLMHNFSIDVPSNCAHFCERVK